MNFGAARRPTLRYRALMARAGLMPPEPVHEDLIIIAGPPEPEPPPKTAAPAASTPALDADLATAPLPEWMAEWAREDALPPPAAPPFEPARAEIPEEPPGPGEADTHILQPEQIFSSPAAPGGGAASPAPVTQSHPVSEEFSASLDDEIEQLMERTRRFVKPAPPAPPRAPQPAFDMPFGTPTPPAMKPPTAAFEEVLEEGVDRGQVLEEMERAAPPSPAPPPAPEVKKKPSRPPVPAWEPPPISSGLSAAGASSAPPAPPRPGPALREPEGGKVRDTARRVRKALTPLLAAGIDPSSPWLSLVILMAGTVWIATGFVARSLAIAAVGVALILPVIVAGIASGRRPARR